MQTLAQAYRKWGIRQKLMVMLSIAMAIPLMLIALYAWSATANMGEIVLHYTEQMSDAMLKTQNQTSQMSNKDAVDSLNARSREAIESLTTQIAKDVSDFLYVRDNDILRAAALPQTEERYRAFMSPRRRNYYEHGKYVLTPEGDKWMLEAPLNVDLSNPVRAPHPDNAQDFHTRAREIYDRGTPRPLYLEMTFVDMRGMEKIKIQEGNLLKPGLRDISEQKNTFLGAENYWDELKKLKAGEIYVSHLIGESLHTDWIGLYSKEEAARRGKVYAPEKSGYAGLENPVGKRFRGIIRWATPVLEKGKIIGFVTLALDHLHLNSFINTVSPTHERFVPIVDPASGNYAFIWDNVGRAIAHPRDYFIAGIDPKTGAHAPPRMDETLWQAWQKSGKAWHEFSQTVPPMFEQSLQKFPAKAIDDSGFTSLDCRYMNFAPQCDGWYGITEFGGSGSFLVFFSDIWKLTTAAAIPYYTGQYGKSLRGFGIVTIGANITEFNRSATDSAARIEAMIKAGDALFSEQRLQMEIAIKAYEENVGIKLLIISLIFMVGIFIISSLMTSKISNKVTQMRGGIARFQEGDLTHRLLVEGEDEMAELASSFNQMANEVARSFKEIDEARKNAEEASRMKTEFLANMSHEFRTPLNGILGFSELLAATLEDEESREYAQTIQDSGKHLLRVVTDVLDIAKIEAGRMEFNAEDLELRPLLQQIVDSQQALADAKKLHLQLDVRGMPETIHADQTRLTQVLLNIVNNAIKFTHEGHVILRACMDQSKKEEKWVRITVSDTGMGIAENMHHVVFEKFRQVESFNSRKEQGVGLGLSLAKNIVEQMGGKIGLTSKEGAGSVFYVTLPLKGEL